MSHLTQYDTDILTVYSDCEEDVRSMISKNVFKHLIDVVKEQNLHISNMKCAFYDDNIIVMSRYVFTYFMKEVFYRIVIILFPAIFT